MAVTGSTNDRARRARNEPLRADQIAPGMFEVSNLRSGSTHVVDVREQACECKDYQYRMGPAGGRCKHLEFVHQIAEGDLCSHCGYKRCRPSCPNKGER